MCSILSVNWGQSPQFTENKYTTPEGSFGKRNTKNQTIIPRDILAVVLSWQTDKKYFPTFIQYTAHVLQTAYKIIKKELYLSTALLYEFGHQGCPAGLVAGPQTGPSVPIKIFIKKNMITPVRILLYISVAAIHRPASAPGVVLKKDPYQAPAQVPGNLVECCSIVRIARKLNLKFFTIIVMIFLQRLNHQVVDRKPDRPRQLELPPNKPLPDSAGS